MVHQQRSAPTTYNTQRHLWTKASTTSKGKRRNQTQNSKQTGQKSNKTKPNRNQRLPSDQNEMSRSHYEHKGLLKTPKNKSRENQRERKARQGAEQAVRDV